jgi:hypothetical protein
MYRGAWLRRSHELELSADVLAERWTLDAGNWDLLANKTGATRLGVAALLKFFEAEGRFPRTREELPMAALRFLAQQVRVPAEAWDQYRWTGRTLEYHRARASQSPLANRREMLEFAERQSGLGGESWV